MPGGGQGAQVPPAGGGSSRSPGDAGQGAGARESALRLLARRSFAPSEIQSRLFRMGYGEDAVRDALAYLEEAGYCSEGDAARQFLVGPVQRRGLGRRRARDELLRKGISPRIVGDLLDELLPREGEAARACAVLRAELRRSPSLTARRGAGRLLRRGFEEEDVRRALDQVMSDGPFADEAGD